MTVNELGKKSLETKLLVIFLKQTRSFYTYFIRFGVFGNELRINGNILVEHSLTKLTH